MSRDETVQTVPRPNPAMVLAILAAWGVLVFAVLWPWMHQFDLLWTRFSVLGHVSAAVWWLVLLWVLHHLSFQVAGLFARRKAALAGGPERPPLAILYTTCDDFSEGSCLSCVEQDYPNYRVLVCDDSRQEQYRAIVSRFCADHPLRCTLVRREGTKGFKAGNLNNAIRQHVREDWMVVVDADQILPPDYLSRMAAHLPPPNSGVAYVQGAHEPVLDEESSPLQRALSPAVSLFYLRDFVTRPGFGFVTMLGHGAAVSRRVLEAVGGFPEQVSEDFALALRTATVGLRGMYVPEVVSRESFPFDFGGFVMRIRKFAGGTAELCRRNLMPFLGGRAGPVEKWDLLMMVAWYGMMPFVMANAFLGAYVCHVLWKEGTPYLHPVLPYLYFWLWMALFVLGLSTSSGWWAAIRFYFWSTAIYTAVMPVIGGSFVKHLFSSPTFERTPKNRESRGVGAATSSGVFALGAAALILACIWFSPFSPFLAGAGMAWLCFPLYGRLCQDSFVGRIARTVIYLPGALVVFALYAMWTWGYC